MRIVLLNENLEAWYSHAFPAVVFADKRLEFRKCFAVAQIYQSIEFTRLASLVPFVDAFQLERAIVDAARHCDLQVRINHSSRTLSFGSDLNYSPREDSPVGPYLQPMPSEQIRSQLTAMSAALAKAIQVVKPTHLLHEKEEQHQQAVSAYLKNARKEHQRILARRQTIEERKERLESLNVQREKEEMELREAELQKVRKAEEERLRQEAQEREKERLMQEHENIKRKHVRERLEQIKKTELGAKAFRDIDIENLEELDPDFIMAKQVEQLEKEKKELQERLKNQEKKIDFFERAKRLEEIPLLKKAFEEQRIKDMELWELQEEERITSMKVEREKALEHKNRMSRMMDDQDLFLTKLMASQKEKLKNFQDRLNAERKMRLEERKKQRKEERRRIYYIQKEEEAQRLEEEKLKKEREEKERCEREKREAEEREYQEKLRKLEETERKRRQREMEIEERERRKEEERKYAEDQFRRKESQRWSDRDSERDSWRDSRIIDRDSEWRRGGTDAEWRRGESRGFDDDRPAFRRGEDRIRRDDDREPLFRRGDDDRGPLFRRGDDDRGSWRDDDRGPRRVDDSRPGPWRPLDKPESQLDKDDGPWRRGGGSEESSWREAPRRDDRDGDRDRRDFRERRDIKSRKDEPERRAAPIRSDRDDVKVFLIKSVFGSDCFGILGCSLESGQYLMVCALSPLAPHKGQVYRLKMGQSTLPSGLFRMWVVYRVTDSLLFLQKTQICSSALALEVLWAAGGGGRVTPLLPLQALLLGLM
eukprot:g48264.t1